MTRVVIHVERLVLNGFLLRDRHAIHAGLRMELERVFADPKAMSSLSRMRDTSVLHVGQALIGRGATPHHVGLSVAEGIAREMQK